MNLKKRGLSPVVASVLIILITVVAAMVIASFVIPWVGQIGEEGQECFNVLGDLSFKSTPYMCYGYDEVNTQNVTGFSVEINSDEIEGFILFGIKGGSSDRFVILDGDSHPELKMLENADFNTPLDVPSRGGVVTYVYDGYIDSFEIRPILKGGNECERSDSFEPRLCSNDEVVLCMSRSGDFC